MDEITEISSGLPPVSTRAPKYRIDAEGSSLYLVWEDSTDGDYDVYFARSDDGGSTWDDITDLSEVATDDFLPFVSTFADTVVVGWVTDAG